MTQTITIQDKNQTSDLKIDRMTIYKQSRIIEARDAKGHTHYVFFYENEYLNYVTPKADTTYPYVKNAFQNGTTITPPHPLIHAQCSNTPYKKKSFNDLFAKLPKHRTLQETVLIATYFEGFIMKEKLVHLIKKLYYQNRRDGKLLSCFRILNILRDFAPNHSVTHSFTSDLQFTRYAALYKTNDESVLSRDPIYVEKQAYAKLPKASAFQTLDRLYQQQNRWIDRLTLHIRRVQHTQNETNYLFLKTLINEYIPENRFELLEDLSNRGLTVEPFLQDMLQAYLDDAQLESALQLICQHELVLYPTQSEQLITIVKQKELITQSLTPEGLQKLILTVCDNIDEEQASTILYEAVSSLLIDQTPAYVQSWAQPIKDIKIAEPLIKKIDEMNILLEDPSQQRRLGELYHYFHQPQKAIECMSWEMELNDEDPKPVQWLSKLYHEVGMLDEHKAYQKLYVDMVKRA
ncbi:hypothetical protein GCM10010954_31440 [Halobacillus andaensis]|uniref:Uncharacterized protein n=1 Tax=Halobacillus andaensis TaxID=1176239 RepID=A0A917B9Y6_HALAA|nr:hypothetical protein [Halobacillus andaensis]MBP2005250.1 hypothetical protein [Halobacillus andaensis]GGF30003.1 hypothetical protein GCM10010954_31440 [Halobacillus andaensis]